MFTIRILPLLEVPVPVLPCFPVGLFSFIYWYALQILGIALLLITYIVSLLFQFHFIFPLALWYLFMNEAS